MGLARLVIAVLAVLLAGVVPARSEGLPAAAEAARNPFLAAETYGADGFNSSRTGVFVHGVSPGTFKVDLLKAPRIRQGPVNLMTYASPSPRFLWAVSSRRVAYVELKLSDVVEVAALELGANPVVVPVGPTALDRLLQPFPDLPRLEETVRLEFGPDPQGWPSLSEGGVAVVSIDNVLYVNSGPGGTMLLAIRLVQGDPGPGLKVMSRLDLATVTGPSGKPVGEGGIVGLNMTYDGRVIAVGRRSVAVIERTLAGQPQVISLGNDETVSHGVAVDAKGGIYVASDRMMHKLVWNGFRLTASEADGAWAAPYDTGRRPPAGKTGTGAGSAPVLMGFGDDPDKLVVITDGADRMKLVAFWRDHIPNRFVQRPRARTLRVAGQIEVSCGVAPPPDFLQSGHSVVAHGYDAFVVNTVRPQGADQPLLDTMATGPILAPAAGAERFEWNAEYDQWRSVWTRGDVVTSGMAPALSARSATVLVHGYTKEDGWELTGMDWMTGRTVHRTLFGQHPLGNGGFGAIQFLGDDDLLFDSLGGPTRVQLKLATPKKKAAGSAAPAASLRSVEGGRPALPEVGR
ncbi:MAG TPA: hypothetical protein VFC25_01745 [Verrucomicrobiae bacterium]|nr:hypothetical protein [Verrucomicrobiae bacterium]